MGFLDDLTKNIDGGIKSVQGWGAAATETLRNLTPETRQIGTELDKLTGKNNDKLILEKVNDTIQNTISSAPQAVSKAWEETAPKVTETLRNIDPVTQQIGKELDIITGVSDDKPYIQKVADTITADVPDIPRIITKDIPRDVGNAWNETTNTVTNTVEKTIIQPVKETVQNVTKGVSEALPIVALGAGGLILASLLLGRR